MSRRRSILPRLRSRRARLTAAGVALLVLVGIVLGGYFYVKGRTGSVYNRDAPFRPEAEAKVTPVVKSKPKAAAPPFVWPVYGFTPRHHRYLPAEASMKPPFRQIWESRESALLEFPPVISGNRIYQLADDGIIDAIEASTGHIVWSKQIGVLSASTPAIAGGTVYATVLTVKGGEGGGIYALNASTGAIIWSHQLPSRSESSPIVANGKVIFGSENGTVYALNATTGSTIWTYQAAGAVKASPTLNDGVLYFGDYAGDVQAISEATGRRIWISSSEGAPLGSGTFYSTAAYAYGRIYLGNTDGRIYAYNASNGELAWAVQTGAYVYSSPAVRNVPGLGPTIFEGSYDGYLYALNAKSGAIDWKHYAGGKISGSATVIGEVVYYSDLGTHSTAGLNVRTGQQVFSIAQGAFDPGISDGHTFYLDGYNTLYALQPTDAQATSTTSTTATSGAEGSAPQKKK